MPADGSGKVWWCVTTSATECLNRCTVCLGSVPNFSLQPLCPHLVCFIAQNTAFPRALIGRPRDRTGERRVLWHQQWLIFPPKKKKRAGRRGSEPLAQSRSAATAQFCVDFQDGRCCLDRFLFLFRHGGYVRREDRRFIMTEIVSNPRNDRIGFKSIFLGSFVSFGLSPL